MELVQPISSLAESLLFSKSTCAFTNISLILLIQVHNNLLQYGNFSSF